jgi:hypothetical protein
MYAINIQNDVIGLVLRQNCKSKQVTDFIAWPSRCHVTIHENREILCWKQVTENTINWKNGKIWKKKLKKIVKYNLLGLLVFHMTILWLTDIR